MIGQLPVFLALPVMLGSVPLELEEDKPLLQLLPPGDSITQMGGVVGKQTGEQGRLDRGQMSLPFIPSP